MQFSERTGRRFGRAELRRLVKRPPWAVALVFLGVLLGPGAASAQQLTWHPTLDQPPAQLSAAGSNSASPQVEISDSGAAIAVWAQDQGSTSVVQAAFRAPGGNFGAPQTLSTAGSANAFDLAMNGRGDAVVTWYSDTGPSGDQVQNTYAAYAAAGQSAFGPGESLGLGVFPNAKAAIDPQGNAIVMSRFSASRINAFYRTRTGSWTPEVACLSSCPIIDDLAMSSAGEAIGLFGAGAGHVYAAIRTPGTSGSFGALQDISGSAYPSNCSAHVAVDAHGNAVAAWYGYTGGTDFCRPDDGSTLEVRGAFRPAGQPFSNSRTIAPPPNPDPRNLTQEVQVAMDDAGNAVVAYDRTFNVGPGQYEGHAIGTQFMPAGGWFGSVRAVASENVDESPVLDLGSVAISNSKAIVSWTSDTRNIPGADFDSTVHAAVRPAGGSFASEGALSLPGDSAREPFVALGADGSGAAVWTGYDAPSLSDVIRARLIIAPEEPPPPPPPPPPPDTSQIRVANNVEKSGPLVLTAAVSGDVDRLEWTLPGRNDPVVGEVVDGQLQRSVRFRPKAGSNFKVTVKAVGPGGTDTFGRSFKMPRARSGDAAERASEALEGQPAVYAAGFESVLAGTGSGAKARRAGACGATTLFSASVELHGCMRPIDSFGQIPGPELGVLDTLARRLNLPRKDDDVMRAAVALSDGYLSPGQTAIGDGWPVVPRGGASLLAYPQVQALTSSNAALRIGGVDFSPNGGFNLKLKTVGGVIPLPALPRPPSLPKIAGMPLTGDFDVKLEGADAVINAHLKLPSALTNSGVSIQSSVTLRATPSRFIVEGARIGPIDVAVGGVNVKDFRIECAPCGTSTGTWNGQGRALILGGVGVDMAPPRGGVTITDGKLTKLAMGVDFPAPGVPISDNVFIEGINGGFGLDPTRFFAGTTVRAYQLVTIKGSLVIAFPSAATPFILDRSEVGDGFASNLYGPPGFTRGTVGVAGTGQLNLPLIGDQPVANGYMLYEYPGYVALGGGFHLNFDVYGINIEELNIVLSGEGDFDRGVYNFHGDANACILFLCGAVVANASNVGFAACVTEGVAGETISQGIEILWSGRVTPWPIDGCKWSRTFVQVRPGAPAAMAARGAAPGAYAVHVGKGDPSQVIRVDGATGAPRVRVTGPKGQVLESTEGDGQAMTPDGSIRTISLNGAKVTTVGLQDPRPGTYTIEPLAGSSAIRAIGQAEDPPDAKVSGKVTGGGERRVLEYNIRRRPDQRVDFFDIADGGASKPIGTVKGGGRGKLRFAPAPGRGKHQIVAQFELAGQSAERRNVTSFKPPSPKLPKPRKLKAKRHGKVIRASWRPVPGASHYEIAVTTDSGEQQFLDARKPRIVIKRIPKSSAGAVTVRAVDPLRQGLLAKASFKRTAPRRTSLEPLPSCKLRHKGLKCKGG